MNNTQMKTRDKLETGRERAAGVLEKASGIVRERSHQAAEMIDKGGNRAAEALHGSAERVQPRRNFVRRHPKRSALFMVFALMTVLATVLIVRSQLSGEDDDDDFDF